MSNLNSENSAPAEYLAGVCNIGPAEIRKRRIVALVGLALLILEVASMRSTHTSHLGRISIFIPALVFSVGYIQSRKKFCLAFGFMGTFNFGKTREIAKVASAEDRARDRRTAIRIFMQSAVLAAVITLAIVILPL